MDDLCHIPAPDLLEMPIPLVPSVAAENSVKVDWMDHSREDLMSDIAEMENLLLMVDDDVDEDGVFFRLFEQSPYLAPLLWKHPLKCSWEGLPFYEQFHCRMLQMMILNFLSSLMTLLLVLHKISVMGKSCLVRFGKNIS